MHARRMILTGAAALALVGGGTAAGAVIASGPVDGNGVIYGCYTNQALNGSHVFILQDAGTSCPKGTTAISWNEQGPAGPAGPSGPSGPAGPSGPPGPTTTVTVTPSPTPSPTLTASPDNGCNSAYFLGTIASDSSATYTGINVGSSEAWFAVTFASGVSSTTLTVTGTTSDGAPAGSDVMNVDTNCAGTMVANGVTSYTGSTSGTYYVQVIEGSSGADGGFELSASAS
jgi:hypothetical protein